MLLNIYIYLSCSGQRALCGVLSPWLSLCAAPGFLARPLSLPVALPAAAHSSGAVLNSNNFIHMFAIVYVSYI